MAPAAVASHHVGPPDETGMGAGDVSNEPNHPEDQNGLTCPNDCVPSEVGDPLNGEGQLILDGDYSTGVYPYFVDVNSVLRNTLGEAPAYDHQDRIYPGISFLAAWFGWWADKGQGEVLRDDDFNPAGSIPGVADGNADGTINDGHDDHDTHEDTRHTGPWDELVWRGENPWAPQHDHQSHPNDIMYGFVHPGTHDSGPTTDTSNLIGSGADDPNRPDYVFDDRTAQVAQSPGPMSHNNQGYGYINGAGWYGQMLDQSLLIATKITYSANPTPLADGLYDRLDATAADVDVYESVHPQVEQAYRTTVWDPGGPGQDRGDNMDIIHENGTKEWTKDRWNDEGQQTQTLVSDIVEELTKPVSPILGAQDDATGDKPRPHEPDVPSQDYGGNAQYGDDTYNDFGQGEYYVPGDDRHYDGYKDDYTPWTDFQATVASAQYLIQVRSYGSFNMYVANDDNAERTQAPSALWMFNTLGAWYDDTDDNWIGNLDEDGRSTSSDDPYASGQVEDPNDYGDTPTSHDNSEKVEDWTPEWKPADQGTVTATIVPAAPAQQDNNGDGEVTIEDRPWGSTNPPAGVYILHDEDGNQFNPYDDSVEDALGMSCDTPTVAQVNCDEDGEQLSQYVQYGPIELKFLNSGGGNFWLMEDNVVFPTGTLNYKVKIDGSATIESPLTNQQGHDLQGETVTDTDYLVPTDVAGD